MSIFAFHGNQVTTWFLLILELPSLSQCSVLIDIWYQDTVDVLSPSQHMEWWCRGW